MYRMAPRAQFNHSIYPALVVTPRPKSRSSGVQAAKRLRPVAAVGFRRWPHIVRHSSHEAGVVRLQRSGTMRLSQDQEPRHPRFKAELRPCHQRGVIEKRSLLSGDGVHLEHIARRIYRRVGKAHGRPNCARDRCFLILKGGG